MEFKHFSHAHALTLYHMPEGSDNSETLCSGCKLGGLTTVYMCWPCQYFLHQTCFEAKRSLTHSSHPSHPLSLLPCPTYPSRSFICDSCHLTGAGFGYACSDCEFDVHLHCAYATSAPSHSTLYANNPINYSSNYPGSQNPQLTFPQPAPAPEVSEGANPPVLNHYSPQSYHANNPINYSSNYPGCENPQGPQLTFPPPAPAPEVSEANPPVVNHFSPQSYQAENFPVIDAYPPVFNGHIPPATTYSTESKTTQVAKHFSHQHALKQSKIEGEDGLLCTGCEHAISESTAYTCTKSKFCNFRLHKSCFDLPKEINHRSHTAHPLVLLSAPPYKSSYVPEFTCNACFKDGNSFLYHCSTCNFDLHIDCASLPDSVKREDHEHPLRLLHSSPYERSKAGEDEAVFMCDVCERSVDSNCWVYYCGKCDFGTDVGCVNDEIERNEEEGGGGKDDAAGADEDDGLTPAQRLLKMQNEFQLMQFRMQMNQQLAQSIIGMGQSLSNLAG